MNRIRLPQRRQEKVFYGWWLVATGGFVHTLTSVPLFHAMGLWFVALETQFGWSRTQLSFAFAFTRIEGGILGPVEGYLTDKLGTKRIVLIGLLIMSVGFFALSQVQHLWMFYLAFVILALGQGLGGWLPINTMLNNWFKRGRATAMGWASSISRLGGLLMIPAMAWAMEPTAERIGWQVTAAIFGVVILVVALPVYRIIRNRPEDHGLLPDGDPPENEPVEDANFATERSHVKLESGDDISAKQALRTPAFWLISFGHGFTSMVIIGLMAHLAPMMTDQGFSLQTAGWVVTTYTAVSMVFQVVGGYVGDRVPKNVAIFVFTTIQAGAVLILVSATTLAGAFLFAGLFGIGFGGRNPLTTSIRGDYFGRSSFGTIMGLSQAPMNVLLFIAPTFAGYMRDVQGDYSTAFITLAGLSFFGGVLFLFAKKPNVSKVAASSEPMTAD